MRGRAIKLSGPRRLVCDLMWASRGLPRVTAQRRMLLTRLIETRSSLEDRPAWTAIFVRAYGLLSQETPELRRAYVKLPWPQLYEFPESVATIAHEREYRGENVVLLARIKAPEKRSVTELAKEIRAAQTRPISEVKEFNKALRLAEAPAVIRRPLMWIGLNVGRQRGNYFGTFLLSVYSGLGAESFNQVSPLTTLLTYGTIEKDEPVNVRISYDHRVMDGATVARALQRLESILNGPVADELRSAPESRLIRAAPADAALG